MPEESILTDDFLRELINVGEVDIMVGVPTYNDGRTVGEVVQAIRAGLLKYFPRQRAVIINADGGSRDASRDLVRAASISDMNRAENLQALRTLHCVSTRYPGEPSTGAALQTILAAADLLHAAAVVVFSPESTSIEPEWIDRLLRPVIRESFDYVAPIFRRHKFDGLLIRNLLYPMTRAIYGKRVREPFPSDFAISGQFGTYFLNQDIWSHDVGRIGTELDLTITAITAGFRVAQSFLGTKVRTEQAPADLVLAMRQTVGVLFWSLEQNFNFWSKQTESQPVPTQGMEHDVSLDTLRPNRKRLYQMFCHGVIDLQAVLRSILLPDTLSELQHLSSLPEEQFCYRDELWVRTIYEFAAAYHKNVINRDHIVQALAPIYRGRAFCFLVDNRDASAEQIERGTEALCHKFEQLKPQLLELWDGKK